MTVKKKAAVTDCRNRPIALHIASSAFGGLHRSLHRSGPLDGKHAFTLSDEAASVLSEIDAADEPVHLVGHSYGGAVALRAAIERPSKAGKSDEGTERITGLPLCCASWPLREQMSADR